MIAIVDDDALVRKGLARLLRSSGYTVALYESGDEFLTSLHHQPPHCVVLDLHMPGMTGFEVQEALSRNGHSLPTIMVTADHAAEIVAHATLLGAAACLPKPIDA